MLTLVVVGFLAGLITGLSPCILPVLPAVLTTSAFGPQQLVDPAASQPPMRQRSRPYLVIAGLVSSFGIFTLLGGALLGRLGLPQDVMRTLSLVLMGVVGVGLLIPAVGHVLERPFARIPQSGIRRNGSAFLFGATFGLAFVPCAGPVLAAITVIAATTGVSGGVLVLTAAFCAGVAIPLLVFAVAGQRVAQHISGVRRHLPRLRLFTGGVLVVTALVLWLGAADAAQRLVPGYVAAAQQAVEDSDAAQQALGDLQRSDSGAAHAQGPAMSFDDCEQHPDRLQNCGPAPALTGITDWLHTPGDQPLTLTSLRGRVVLVDFWTYSCINCQRTLPYLTAWDAKYRDQGLTIIGVHAPEFAFEHEVANVADQSEKLGVRYPVAIDNNFATWRAYDQRYWPAHYLIDQNGVVRQVHYGEGAYSETESLISHLLAVGDRSLERPGPDEAEVNQAQTPEIYLGLARAAAYAQRVQPGTATFRLAEPPTDGVALGGEWTASDDQITAGRKAKLKLNYAAGKLFLVLGGRGTVQVADSHRSHVVRVSGAPTLHRLAQGAPNRRTLTLSVSPGLSAFAFTFG